MAQITLNSTGVASSGALVLQTNGTTTAVTVDTSQNVGIGTSSPATRLTVADSTTGFPLIRLSGFNSTNNSNYSVIQFFNEDGSGQGPNIAASIKALTASNGNGSGGQLTFSTSTGTGVSGTEATEVMRIDPSGNLGVGLTSPSTPLHVAGNATLGNSVASTNVSLLFNGVASKAKRIIFKSGGTEDWLIGQGAASETDAFEIYNGNGQMSLQFAKATSLATFSGPVAVAGNYVWQQADGSGKGFLLGSSGSTNGLISQTSGGSGSTATYIGNAQITTSSDVRLKENIVDSQRNALEIIDKIRVVDFTWNDPSDQAVNNKASRGVWTGLIAQEAVAHIPWLINKPTQDTEDGRPVYWTADYGHAVPFLMKAIQEQQALITQLQADVAALKA